MGVKVKLRCRVSEAQESYLVVMPNPQHSKVKRALRRVIDPGVERNEAGKAEFNREPVTQTHRKFEECRDSNNLPLYMQ